MDNLTILERHPLSAAFGTMGEADRAELKASIKTDDGSVEITLYEGKALDGWHRYRCMLALGRDPAPFMREFAGDDPAAFVLRVNDWRRHVEQAGAVQDAHTGIPMAGGARQHCNAVRTARKVGWRRGAIAGLVGWPAGVAFGAALHKAMRGKGRRTSERAWESIWVIAASCGRRWRRRWRACSSARSGRPLFPANAHRHDGRSEIMRKFSERGSILILGYAILPPGFRRMSSLKPLLQRIS